MRVREFLGEIKLTVNLTKKAVREKYISNIVLYRKGVSTSDESNFLQMSCYIPCLIFGKLKVAMTVYS